MHRLSSKRTYYRMDDARRKIRNKNPWEPANVVSRLLFTWILKIFKKGYSKTLTIDDLYDVPDQYKSDRVVRELEIAWEDELKSNHANPDKAKFWKAWVRVNWRAFFKYLVFISTDELFIRVLQPIYLLKLIRTFQTDKDGSGMEQLFYAFVVCFSSLYHDLVIHQCVYIMFRTGMKSRVACSSLVYRKALRLSSWSGSGSTVGFLMNLMSNDFSRFDTQLLFSPYVIIGPLQLIILMYFLYDEMGPSAFTSLGFVLLILPTQVVNGKLAAKFRLSVAKLTDERSRLMNEIITAIRVIKMYAWEYPFSRFISSVRKKEVRELGKRAYFRGFFLSLYTFSITLTAFLVIATYVLSGNDITAEKAFFSVSVAMTIVETFVFYFTLGVSGVSECFVAIQRAEKFLKLDECQQSVELNNNSFPVSISLEKVDAKWNPHDNLTLKNISLSFNKEKLTIVAGSVGSGKSSFLNLLLSEMFVTHGNIQVSGDISYCSQESWIFPGSIKQNILFGLKFDYVRYEEVVKVCALKDDLKQLPYGDLTIVGERGITLSGGQKARINLARALYRKADVYLLDDPLSAVDTRVSRHIFEKAIKGYLRNKLVILVTHQLQYLSQANRIVFMSNGKVKADGSYQELLNQGIDLITIMASQESGKENQLNQNNRRKSSAIEAGDALDFDEPVENLETVYEGSVSLSTYWNYIKFARSKPLLLLMCILFVLGQFLITASEYWLSYWTNSEEHQQFSRSSTTSMADTINIYGDSNFSLPPPISPRNSVPILDETEYHGREYYLIIYTVLVVLLFIVTNARSFGFFHYCLRISNNIHGDMFRAVSRTPIKFFDDNPSGRVLNRFTKDIGSIDELLPATFFDMLQYVFELAGVIIIVISSNYYFVLPTVVISVVFVFLAKIFVRTSRDIKRLEAVYKSPVFNHVASSTQGLSTIRALKSQDVLISQFDEKQDIHSAAWFMFISTSRCFAVWAETTGIIFLAIVTFSSLAMGDVLQGGTLGLIITSTLSMTVNIQWAIRQGAETENNMTSVERALEYTKLKPEAHLETSRDVSVPKNWPVHGEIEFQNMSLSYEDNIVLHNINLHIRAKEKVAIVGRTGAGKSSIIAALFRLTEPNGNIFIDGVSIGDIGLHELRKGLSIIPQDPILFSGSIRYNLDPFDQYSDNEIWDALKEVQLKEYIDGLDFHVMDGGANFSVGQRQLVCLARAILRRNKVIIMDEATANVDLRTDEVIQATVRSKFSDCTILTIAHRLHSVMDCDKILVLDAGRVMEFDHPYILLMNENSYLKRLATHTGDAGMEKLIQIAREHYNNSR